MRVEKNEKKNEGRWDSLWIKREKGADIPLIIANESLGILELDDEHQLLKHLGSDQQFQLFQNNIKSKALVLILEFAI